MVAGQLNCWVKLLIHSQNLTFAHLRFETGEVISDDVFVNENVVEIIDNNIDDIFVLPPQTTNTHTQYLSSPLKWAFHKTELMNYEPVGTHVAILNKLKTPFLQYVAS